MKSKIEWTQHTWNPIAGCSHISPGCDFCYAEVMARRLAGTNLPAYQGIAGPDGWTGVVRISPSRLEEPLRRKKPTIYFTSSMTDIFHEALPDNDRDRVFEVMERAGRHQFQFLTKRSRLMTSYIQRRYAEIGIPPNIWLGVSVETPLYMSRARDLLRVDPVVRFLSVEPLLDSISDDLEAYLKGMALRDREKLWVIFGGESGAKARPCDPRWISEGVKVCQRFGAMPFVKQLGTVELLPDGRRKRHKGKRDSAENIKAVLGECVRVDPNTVLDLSQSVELDLNE